MDFGDVLNAVVGGGDTSASSASRQELFGPQADFLSQLYYPGLTDLFNQGAGAIPGFDPLQIQGQQSQLQAANMLGGQIPGAFNALNTLFGAADPNSPLTQGAISAATSPIFENFQNVIAPSIRRNSLGNQPGGGTRLGNQINRAGQEALRTAGQVGQQVALGAHQQGLGAVGQGLGLAPSIYGQAFVPGQIQSGIGQQRRDLALEQSPFGFLNQIQSLFGQPITLSSSESQSQGFNTRGLTQGFNDVFGGAMGGMF